jgi:hypothetical protein
MNEYKTENNIKMKVFGETQALQDSVLLFFVHKLLSIDHQ